MDSIVSVRDVSKVYENGHRALDGVNLEIEKGEILALLGPNGAGKTTLISLICGLVKPSSGQVFIGGNHIIDDYRSARRMTGLVPQELTLEAFETVYNTVCFSRGLFGFPSNPSLVETILRRLSLWEKKDARILSLSGGMKRRVLIAKALSHEPDLLFLDEPSAGVDVELRKDMWEVVRQLKRDGVTIVLTTHYIEEAEAMADRVGIITGGKILLEEDKVSLMSRMGGKHLIVELREKISHLPDAFRKQDIQLSDDGMRLTYSFSALTDAEGSGQAHRTGLKAFLEQAVSLNIAINDIETREASLEQIFIKLLKD